MVNILYPDKHIAFFQEILATKTGLDLECYLTNL